MKRTVIFLIVLVCFVTASFSVKGQQVEGTVAGHELRIQELEKKNNKEI